MIKTVIFDIGNVLIGFDYEPYLRELFSDETVVRAVRRAIWDSGLWYLVDYGEDEKSVLAKIIASAPEYEEEIRLAFCNVGRCMSKRAYAIPWIKELKARGYGVLYLSNYSRYARRIAPEVLDFLPYTDGGVFSYEVGDVKPAPAIYLRLFEKYGLAPEECVFIDDREDNAVSARLFGMKAVVFKGYEETKAELEAELEKRY